MTPRARSRDRMQALATPEHSRLRLCARRMVRVRPVAHSIASGAAMLAADLSSKRNAPTAFLGGAVIGAIGGLIGLGGAEFRLPLLIGAFGFPALQAVILNKAMSLIVVAFALPFRASAVPLASVAAHWSIIINMLAGSLLAAWFGAGWATKLASQTLYRVISMALLPRSSGWRAASC